MIDIRKRTRMFGADVVRVLAFTLLLWLHFLLRNGFYRQPVNSAAMTLAAAARCVFMCCIPLFLILTGYLKCGREWGRGCYRGLVPILISWVIISLVCLCYRIQVLREVKTVPQWIAEFFDYKVANYSWYIEMYIGLGLISPFLNMAWNRLQTRRQHGAMVLVFASLTFLPATFNGLMIGEDAVLNLFPDHWTGLYFFTYYLMGCYIRTYRPKVPRLICFGGVMVIALALGIVNRYTGGAEGCFYDGYRVGYSHLATVVMAAMLFLGVYRLECRIPWMARGMQVLSGVTLEMYLISCVFDQWIYVWDKGTYGPEQYGIRGLLATGLVFVLCFLSGWPIHQISDRLAMGITNRRKME